jgi:hypothetical protein
MAANDVIALKANFTSWEKERAAGLIGVKAFDYYCVDQFLKPFGLADDELLSGLVAGGQDGGVDGIYFLVNRRLVQEDTDLDAKGAFKVNLLILQVKENQGFSPIEIDKLTLFSDDLLDLSRQPTGHQTTYNDKVLGVMKVFKEKFQEIAGAFPTIAIDYYYITQSDCPEGEDARKAAERVTKKAIEHLSAARCEFHFINAAKLWEQVQMRVSKTKKLAWHETPMSTPEGPVGLVHLHEYWRFLQDEHGELHESIFESNVRGFQQNTPVNVAIHDTLAKPDSKADFWVLNNGITILAHKVDSAGHKMITIEDAQIVNGLQTSRQIFSYFKKGIGVPAEADDKRRILVRVLESSDEEVRDGIVRATNSQNKMPPEALRATDRIHSQIETLFRQADLYYDRRKGFYKDQGKPIVKIVPVIELLQAMLSIALKRPNDARARPRDYIKNDNQYEEVFGNGRFGLMVYLQCALLYRQVETFLDGQSSNLSGSHRRNIKFYLAMYVAAAATKDAHIPPDKLLRVNVSQLNGGLISDSCVRVLKRYEKIAERYHTPLGGWDFDQMAKGPELLKAICGDLKRRFPIRKKKAKRGTS